MRDTTSYEKRKKKQSAEIITVISFMAILELFLTLCGKIFEIR